MWAQSIEHGGPAHARAQPCSNYDAHYEEKEQGRQWYRVHMYVQIWCHGIESVAICLFFFFRENMQRASSMLATQLMWLTSDSHMTTRGSSHWAEGTPVWWCGSMPLDHVTRQWKLTNQRNWCLPPAFPVRTQIQTPRKKVKQNQWCNHYIIMLLKELPY